VTSHHAGQGVPADSTTVRRTVLPGGVRVLSEHMPGLRSATIGVWVGVGSRDEAEGHHGSTHFLEHLLFKGTSRRTAMDIAAAFDAVGGEANAATGKEYTCYYARVLDADLPMAVDVIADMVTSATLAEDDVMSERGVILEELAMNDDDPGDVVHERFAEAVLGDNPLGRPIGGTPDSIRAVPRDAIWEHYQQHYRPEGLVITAAGGVEHDALCDLVVRALKSAGWPEHRDARPLPTRVHAGDSSHPRGADSGTLLTVRRSVEQAHVVLGGLGLRATDDRRFTMSVLNAVLGGGMSSRLFQEIREKRGLAYSVYSFSAGYSDAGYFGLYAGCTPSKVPEVVDLLTSEWQRIAAEGITEEELRRGIGQLAGGLVLGMEDTGSRMSRLGKAELVYGEFIDLDEALRRVRAVTAEQVRALAADLLARPRSLTVVGPFEADPVADLPR
jgi:predicted Zn-dependent peptidase